MNLEELNQALSLTIQDLLSKLSDALTAKNLIAIQVVAKDEELERLRHENQDLLDLLDSQTAPKEGSE